MSLKACVIVSVELALDVSVMSVVKSLFVICKCENSIASCFILQRCSMRLRKFHNI
jgi:hypothetical protein